MFRRALKWSGAIACVLVVFIWFGSRWCRAQLTFVHGSSLTDLLVTKGQVSLLSSRAMKPGGWHVSGDIETNAEAGLSPQWTWWFGVDDFRPLNARIYHVPLWSMLMLLLIPTTWIWYRDRPRPGHCPNCNYNLSGLDKSPCPECGHPQS